MSKENRKHLRIGLVVDIELSYEGQSPVCVRTRNISDGGIYLVIDDIELPPVGSEVMVKLKNQLGEDEEAPLNRARVVRQEPDGIGLEFLE